MKLMNVLSMCGMLVGLKGKDKRCGKGGRNPFSPVRTPGSL